MIGCLNRLAFAPPLDRHSIPSSSDHFNLLRSFCFFCFAARFSGNDCNKIHSAISLLRRHSHFCWGEKKKPRKHLVDAGLEISRFLNENRICVLHVTLSSAMFCFAPEEWICLMIEWKIMTSHDLLCRFYLRVALISL